MINSNEVMALPVGRSSLYEIVDEPKLLSMSLSNDSGLHVAFQSVINTSDDKVPVLKQLWVTVVR